MDDKLWDSIECFLMSMDKHNEELYKMNSNQSINITDGQKKCEIIAQQLKDKNVKLVELSISEPLVNDGEYHVLTPNEIYLNHGGKFSSIITKSELEKIKVSIGPKHKEMDEDLFELQKLGELHVSPSGAKRNSNGKTPYQFIPLDLLDGAAFVMQKGADEYGNDNYRLGFEPFECFGSLMRHCESLQKAIRLNDKDGEMGILLDKKSGEAHVHHILTNAFLLIQSMRVQGWKV
jgi:hypothetical protein